MEESLVLQRYQMGEKMALHAGNEEYACRLCISFGSGWIDPMASSGQSAARRNRIHAQTHEDAHESKTA